MSEEKSKTPSGTSIAVAVIAAAATIAVAFINRPAPKRDKPVHVRFYAADEQLNRSAPMTLDKITIEPVSSIDVTRIDALHAVWNKSTVYFYLPDGGLEYKSAFDEKQHVHRTVELPAGMHSYTYKVRVLFDTGSPLEGDCSGSFRVDQLRELKGELMLDSDVGVSSCQLVPAP